ncbi:hypothetical protein ACT8ZV_20370 [Nocardioides sp. MAHUQ-72]|uniref:hypothetical protein n=1 Tax=unclassified Nocardioides TaxID=2615069 RepID=UPI00360607E2
MRALVARLAAAVVLTAAAGLVVPAAPATAAACPDADGVTVVVDYHELGGGLQQVCDSGGAGKTAAQQLTESGFTLTRVQQQPGFVCRVDGLPTQDEESCVRTPPADAYWGLWWSDGTSGTWTYATEGVDALEVPEGGYVALSWNGSSTKSPPGAAPRAHASSSPSPTPHPTAHPTTSGGGTGPGTGGSSPSGGTTDGSSPSGSTSTSPSASGSAVPDDQMAKQEAGKRSEKRDSAEKKKHTHGPTDGASPSAEDSASPSPASATSDPPGTDSGGLPSWVAPAAIGLLFAAAAGTAVVRRRRGTPGP